MADTETNLETTSQNEKTSDYLPRGSDKITEIALGNTKVKVKTDATPALLKQTRELVEAKFEEFSDSLNRGISAEQMSVLVAFNLAEELLSERERLKFFKRNVLESSERLINRVETHLNKKNK